MKGKLLGLSSVLFVGLGLVSVGSIASATAFAQTEAGKGAVAGVVSDPTQAVIPNATVTLANPGIGYKQTVKSNSEGYFAFQSLTVADGYTLTVTAAGFTSSKIASFPTSVGTVITENVSLAVGNEGTVVEVQGGTQEQVQVNDSQLSQLIDAQVFTQAPLLIRDTNTFVGLTAGAATDSAGTGRGYAVNGARTGTGNFLLEGFDNNDQGLGGGGGALAPGSVVSISPDAVQEYRVITSVPNAEYGRAGGFTTDTVLRSGTNKIHGSLFEYNRMQALAQNDFFSNRAGLRDHLVFNQFGGSVGGPIYKDKTFFFAGIELLRLRQGNPETFTGVTQDYYNFVQSGNYKKWMEGTAFQNTTFITDPNTGGQIDGQGFCPENFGTTCPNGFADTAAFGPTFSKLVKAHPEQFPFPTRNFTNIPTDLYIGDTEYTPVNIYGDGSVIDQQTQNVYRGSLKLDHKLTDKDQLAFTYAIEQDSTADNINGGISTPGPGELDLGGAQIFGARWSHTFTPNLLNDFRAGYLRHVRDFYGTETDNASAIASADSLSVGFGNSNGLPQPFTENQFSYEDAVTWTVKHHNLKSGFRFARTRNGSSFYNDVNGEILFWGANGLMSDGLNEVDAERLLDGGTTGAYHSAYGTLYYGSGSIDPSTGAPPDPYRGYRANEFAAYAQDDWKVTPKLFVNYGIRWDYFGPPHNFRGGIDSNVYFGSHSSIVTANPFAPGGSLYLAMESTGITDTTGAGFRCVGYSACGNPADNPFVNTVTAQQAAGYAGPSNTPTIWDRDLNNFAPRLGFSYDTYGNGKLVLRGGFGIGFDRLYNNVYENIRFNAPHFVDNTAGYGAGGTGISEALRTSLVQVPFVGNAALPAGSAVPRHVNQHLKTAYYEQIHFGVQTDLVKGYVMDVSYVGTLGRQLVGLMNANTFEGRVACSGATLAAACAKAGLTTAQMSTIRPNQTFGNDNFRTNGFSSNYNGGQVSVRKGYAHGFQVNANYTYSKAMDQISDVFTIKSGGTGIANPYNPSRSYGPADFDVRHQFTATLNYRSQSAAHKYLIAGWGFSPIFKMHSGTPIYMKNGNSSYDPNKDGVQGVERVVYTGTGSIRNSINHATSPAGNGTTGSGWIKPGLWKSYTCPASVNAGLFCDVPGDRNSMYGLRQYNLDLQVSKSIPMGERFSLLLQAAFFDADGHPEFGNPSGDINSTSFGQSTSAGFRQGLLSGRIEF